MTVFTPVDGTRSMDFHANDVGYVSGIAPPYIEQTASDEMVLRFFAAPLLGISLSQRTRYL
jgi:hypothetical protein